MKKTSAALVALIAAGAGYLGGLLSAPRSGKQTRKQLSRSASKAKVQGEKQLKGLYTEVKDNLDKVEARIAKTRGKASDEMKDAVKAGKEAQAKAKMLLSALHDGDVDDPNLKAVIADVKSARDNLEKFAKTSGKSKK